MALNLSTEPDDYRQRLALMLSQSGLDSSPIRSGWQGASRLAHTLAGGMMMNNIAQEQGDANKQVADFLMKMAAGGQPNSAGAPTDIRPRVASLGDPTETPPPSELRPTNPLPAPVAAAPSQARPSPMPPAQLGPVQSAAPGTFMDRWQGISDGSPTGNNMPAIPGGFDNRWAGVTDAIKEGVFDPQGQNYSAFASANPPPAAGPPMPPQAPMMPSPNGPNTYSPMIGGPPPRPMPQGGPAGAPTERGASMPPPTSMPRPTAPQGGSTALQQTSPMQSDADLRGMAAQLIANPRVDPTIKQAILGQFLPKDNQIMQMPDGTVLAVNARTGTAVPLYKGPPKPQIVPEGAALVSEQGNKLYESAPKPQVVGEGASLVGPKGEPLFQGQPKPPTGYEWANGATPTGQKSLQPIVGGPESKLTGNTAGHVAMLDSALSDWDKTRATLLAPWGIGGTIGHVTGSFDVGRAQRNVTVALEAALRMMSGAAVPEAEVTRYKQMFMPGPMDNPQTAAQKLDNLEAFMRKARSNIMQGRVLQTDQPQGAQRADPMGLR
jgi:hypothetical protein